MRRKRPRDEVDPDAQVSLRGELERLGLSEAEAAPLADQLVRLAARLPAPEYRALVEGVVLGAQAGSAQGASQTGFQNLLEDFTTELKKLDEGLKLLTAYLSRLRAHREAEPSRTLH